MLEKAVCIGGPDAVEPFFDPKLFKREAVLPRRIRRTLLGDGGIHSLDGEPQRLRKAMFLQALGPHRITEFREIFTRHWEAAVSDWTRDKSKGTVFFDAVRSILCGSSCEFAGVPTSEVDAGLCDDLFQMVDSFAAVGPLHWRGRMARSRRERWASQLIHGVRSRTIPARENSALHIVAAYRDVDGRLLPDDVAGVELLNCIRPIMAVTYFAELAAAVLIINPVYRPELDDDAFLESFVHELRRYCPFTPVLGARPCRDLEGNDYIIPKGVLTIIDIYGIHYDERIWRDPHAFIPDRFIGQDAFQSAILQQGGGAHANGHRCAGEWITVETLKLIVAGLARLSWRNKGDAGSLAYDLRRIPARLKNPVVLEFA